MDALLVSRAHELLMLDWAFLRVVGERTYHLFSVLGPAGVGKSRPVAEATRAMAEGRGRRRRPPDQPPTLFEHAV